MAETLAKANENYKACETLMVKLVQLLMDPQAHRTEQKEESKQEAEEVTTEGFVVLDSPTKTIQKTTNPSTATAVALPSHETSSDGKQVRVRRGTEITYDNCPTLSIYELRQELVRRGSFAEFLQGTKKINFNNMLRCLQSLILNDRQVQEEQRADDLWEKPEAIKARLMQAKADRKAQAVERSAVR